MKQVFNPYLPLYEYVPDGEPHIFGDRLYIYGSHDYAGGEAYCMGHYVTWSAPLDDLSDWRYEGIIYKRTQDPTNVKDEKELWAPDVCQGPDGRYYMYYCFSFVPEIGVAVSDSPTGPFEFYGHVKYSEDIMGGKELNEHLPFDPAIFVDDDKRVFLYYGFSPARPMGQRSDFEAQGLSEEEIEIRMAQMKKIGKSDGAMVVELEHDMLTMKGEPKMMVPGGLLEEGTGFEGHGFFEASSMRKIGSKYYFVYSSKLSHELCYATSDYPDRDFTYGGVIVSNGDIGYKGNEVPKNMLGNNHGGMIQVNGQWYIFYHRQTHATESSRQGCAEAIEILPDGSIPQVEITSCGLNGRPLKGQGKYPAAIACYLSGKNNLKKITYGESLKESLPYIYEEQCGETEQEHIHYIANITDGVKAGYKYFECKDVKAVTVAVSGQAKGTITVYTDEAEQEKSGEASLVLENNIWKEVTIPLSVADGVHGIFFKYEGEGAFRLKEIEFVN